MSKGKYNRKRDNARNRQQQGNIPPHASPSESAEAEQEWDPPDPKDEDRPQEEENRMRVAEILHRFLKLLGRYLGRPSPTDWLIAAFSFVLAGTTIYQFHVTDKQLNVMQFDERAWLEVSIPQMEIDTTVVASAQPIGYPVMVKNVGKSPARNVFLKVAVEVPKVTRGISLGCVDAPECLHDEIIGGILFPNQDMGLIPTYWHTVDPGHPHLATDADVAAWQRGETYFAEYGIVTYDDIFGQHHWTRFCSWKGGGIGQSLPTRNCASYNNADGEQNPN